MEWNLRTPLEYTTLWRSFLRLAKKSIFVASLGGGNVTAEDAWAFAHHWIAAWNSHDLGAILSLYDDAVELTSPVAARVLARSDGKVVGKEELRAYFRRGLEAFPQLRFELEDVLCGLSSVVLYYKHQSASRTAEFMELSKQGKVVRVVANYSVPRPS